MKEIKKVCFSEEKCQGKVQMSETSGLRRLPPSGSGSGGGPSSDGGVDTGKGEISSSHGGSWSASCSFGWQASFSFVKKNLSYALTSVRIQSNNIYVSCQGCSSGKDLNGVCFEPNQCGFIVPSHGYSESSSSGVSNTMSFSAILSRQSFGITKNQYNDKGEIVSSELLAEKKDIKVSFSFCFNEVLQKIEFLSCQISASEAY